MLTPAASRRLRFHHADSKKPSSVFSQMKQLPFAEAKLSRIMSRASCSASIKTLRDRGPPRGQSLQYSVLR